MDNEWDGIERRKSCADCPVRGEVDHLRHQMNEQFKEYSQLKDTLLGHINDEQDHWNRMERMSIQVDTIWQTVKWLSIGAVAVFSTGAAVFDWIKAHVEMK